MISQMRFATPKFRLLRCGDESRDGAGLFGSLLKIAGLDPKQS